MLLFGSEEHVERWCTRQRVAPGAILPMAQTWALAKRWFENRLDPAWRRPTAEEATRTLAAVGLTGDFWLLP